MIRVLLTKPKKRRSGLTGLVMYEDGEPVAQAVIQERRNKTSAWESVPIIKYEDTNHGQ